MEEIASRTFSNTALRNTDSKLSKFTIQPVTIFLLKKLFILYLRTDHLFHKIKPSRPYPGQKEKTTCLPTMAVTSCDLG